MRQGSKARACIFSVLCLLAIPAATWGSQSTVTDSGANPTTELSTDTIQLRLAKLQENKDLDPAIKARLVEIYGKTLDVVKAAIEARARSEKHNQLARDAPQTLQSLQADLAQSAAELPLGLPDKATLAQDQQRLVEVETALAEKQKDLKEIQDQFKFRSDRRAEIPKLLETTRQQLQDLEQQLQVKPSPDDQPDVFAANRLLLEARCKSLQADATAIQAELRFYEAAVDLLPVKRDLAARSVAQLESLVKRLREEVNDRRRSDAEQQAKEARRVAAQAHPALRAIAERNEELAHLRQMVAEQIEIAVRDLDILNSRVTKLKDQFARIAKRVETGQYRQSIGLLLRKERDELPTISSERRKIQTRSAEIAATSLQLIEFEDERSDLATLDGRLDEVVGVLTEEERMLLEDDVREMLQTQRNYLDAIIADSNSSLDKLVEENARQNELISKVQDYAEYCDERILWIRSAPAVRLLKAEDFTMARDWLIDGESWRTVGEVLRDESKAHPWSTGLLAAAWLLCLAGRSRVRRIVCDWGDQAARGSCRFIGPTMRAIPLTLAMACPWPILCALAGIRLAGSDDSTDFAHAIGQAFIALAWLFGALEVLRQVCRPRGLAESHFAWNVNSLKRVRRGVFWIMACGLPLALVVLATEYQPNEAIKNSLGRVAFLAVNALLLFPAYQAARPSGGVFSPAYQSEPAAWWSRLRWLWLGVALSGPLALMVLASIGFYYTAAQLAGRMLMTGWLIVGLIVSYGFLLRWSLIAYRNLGMQRLQERRAAAAEAPNAAATATANTQLEIKLADINQQTRRLLQLVLAVGLAAGVWWIWVPVVPALGMLKHVVLWTLESRAPGGDKVVVTTITLADLILSAIVMLFTITVSRNLPSLLELTVLKRLPLDAGARYAAVTVARYMITGLGSAVSACSIGLQWSQIQWLVAAISVGLGFGLQEIFANFFSGLVLLFERPIRIGDIVTVGDIDGKVSNIKLRATTITDWDLRELIVPNKEFITGRVINWTLSNTVSRMAIEVGVAYGTNPDQVRAALLDVAKHHPLALKEPAPHALLDKFADSTLNFVLRVYMPSRDVYLQLRHELMTQIAARFEEEGIVFAFPQCEVRVEYAAGSQELPADHISGARRISA